MLRKLVIFTLFLVGSLLIWQASAAYASATYPNGSYSDFHGLDIQAYITGSGTDTQLMGYHLKDVTVSCMDPLVEIQGPGFTLMEEHIEMCPGGVSNPTLYGPNTPAGPYLYAVYLAGWGWWEHSFTVS